MSDSSDSNRGIRPSSPTGVADQAAISRLLEHAESLNIRFLNLEFTDVVGLAKCVTIPVEQLADCLDQRQMVRRLGHRRICAGGRDRYVPAARPDDLCGRSVARGHCGERWGRRRHGPDDLRCADAHGRALRGRPARCAAGRARGGRRTGLPVCRLAGTGILPAPGR